MDPRGFGGRGGGVLFGEGSGTHIVVHLGGGLDVGGFVGEGEARQQPQHFVLPVQLTGGGQSSRESQLTR